MRCLALPVSFRITANLPGPAALRCGAQLRSPLQGRLWENCRLKGSPVRGAVGVSRLRGAAPCLANTLSGRREPSPAGVNDRGAGMVGGWRLWSAAVPCVGADVYIGPPTGLAIGWRLRVSARLRPQCRAGDFARRFEVCAAAGFPGRCKHRPLRNTGQGSAGFAGYLRRKAAMHPSVCALRRSHRPVCGARIARRALKHACALRPSNLLRLAFSAAGGTRLRSPLQGRLFGGTATRKAPL